MDYIQHWIMNNGLPIAITLALGLAVKKLPDMLENRVKAAIDKLFAAGDAADDVLLIALIQWAQTKYGAGTGPQKAAACVDKLLALLPAHYRLFVSAGARQKAVDLFEQSFARLGKLAKEYTTPK